MEHGTLQNALEAQRRLRVAVVLLVEVGRVLVDEVLQLAAQLVQVGAAGAQHLGRGGVVQQGEQQVLDGHEFVALLAGLFKGEVQRYFKLFT